MDYQEWCYRERHNKECFDLQGESAKLREEKLSPKIGKLYDHAFAKAWDKDMNDESPIDIVTSLIGWGNFLSIWQIFRKFQAIQIVTLHYKLNLNHNDTVF